MGALSQEEWLAFVADVDREYESTLAQYGGASDALLRAASSAAGDSPEAVIAAMRDAMGAVADTLGPAGAVANGILQSLIDFGTWLVSSYPAVPDYDNVDALERVAAALGYSPSAAGVARMTRDGWICGNVGVPPGARKPDGNTSFDTRETFAWFLMPKSWERGGPMQAVEQSWGVGLERASALLSGGSRIVAYQSQVSSRKRYSAMCVKVASMPVGLAERFAVYLPLVISLGGAHPPERPEWWPPDAGLSWLCHLAGGTAWQDAPAQRILSANPLLARKLAELMSGAGRYAAIRLASERVRRMPTAAPALRPAGGGGAVLALGALAALAFV